MGVLINAQPPERERNAASHGVGLERRLVDRIGPVGFGDLEALGAAPVLDGGIEGYIRAYRSVVLPDRRKRAPGVHILELFDKLLQAVGPYACDLANAVLVAQQGDDLVVEDLPGELAGLPKDNSAVFRVGVIADVGALVDKALAARVQHDTERVAVLLEVVAHCEIAERGGVALPTHGMTA